MEPKRIKVRLKHSPIGRVKKQGLIVKGLGLRKLGDVRELVDTPAIRGMIKKIPHLVEIVEESQG